MRQSRRFAGLSSVLLSVLGAVSACAAPQTPGQVVQQTVRVSGPVGSVGMTTVAATEAHARIVPYVIEQVWAVLPAVYDSLGIVLTKIDSTQRVMGNDNFDLRRQLRGVPLRRYFDCGRTQIDENADTYQVNLSILTQVVPEEGVMTKLVTSLVANARPIQFAGDWVRCRSTGRLETTVAEILVAKMRW